MKGGFRLIVSGRVLRCSLHFHPLCRAFANLQSRKKCGAALPSGLPSSLAQERGPKILLFSRAPC